MIVRASSPHRAAFTGPVRPEVSARHSNRYLLQCNYKGKASLQQRTWEVSCCDAERSTARYLWLLHEGDNGDNPVDILGEKKGAETKSSYYSSSIHSSLVHKVDSRNLVSPTQKCSNSVAFIIEQKSFSYNLFIHVKGNVLPQFIARKKNKLCVPHYSKRKSCSSLIWIMKWGEFFQSKSKVSTHTVINDLICALLQIKPITCATRTTSSANGFKPICWCTAASAHQQFIHHVSGSFH